MSVKSSGVVEREGKGREEVVEVSNANETHFQRES